MMTHETPFSSRLALWQKRAYLTGAVAGVLLAILMLVDVRHGLRGYLYGYLYWLSFGVGSLAVVMLHRVTGGAWGFAIRRLLEAAMRTLPLLALLFLPILLGVRVLFPWADPEIAAHDELIQHKSAYLNVPFFAVRAVVYFGLWILLSRLIDYFNARFDRSMDRRALRRLRAVSAVGLGVYVLTMTFASTDWGMSLEPHWFSTIYGVQFVVAHGLTTLCFAVLVSSRMARREPFSRWLGPQHFHDLGNLMLAFVMLWAYMAFSQFLIIWSGNLPEETPWYLHRTHEGWQILAFALFLLHFLVPFLALIVRDNKRRPERLAKVALLLLGVRLLDWYWTIVPAFHPDGFTLALGYVLAPVAIGGLWVGTFLKCLRGRPLLSLEDARLQKELEGAAQA